MKKMVVLIILLGVCLGFMGIIFFDRMENNISSKNVQNQLIDHVGNIALRGESGFSEKKTTQIEAFMSMPAIILHPEFEKIKRMQMSSKTRTVIGLDLNSKIETRRDALKTFTRHLSRSDIEGLMAFLKISYEKYPSGISLEDTMALKNDILEILVKQEEFPRELTRELIGMAQDSDQDLALRDYGVQYLSYCFDRSHESSTNERGDILEFFFTCLSERTTTIAGTALIGLEMATRGNVRDRTRLDSKILEITLDDNASEATRITALRIAAQTGAVGVLPTARMLSQIGETSMLRMAAIATIGDLGQPDDLELLESLFLTSEIRIKTHLSDAIRKLNSIPPKGQR